MPEGITTHIERQRQANSPIRCKACGSERTVGYGSNGGKPRRKCLDCGRVLSLSGALPGMRFPANVVADARALRDHGLSLRAIRAELGRTHGVRPSPGTILRWIGEARGAGTA